MAEEVKKSDETTVPIVGLILLAVVGYGIYRGIVYLLNLREAPPPVVALSAYFADDNGNPVLDEKTPNAHLKIKGQVQRPDNQATDGKVRVTVETLDQTFNQTLIIDTKGGNFETEDASLRKLRTTDEIHIKAEFLASASSKEPPGELYLNTRPPKVTSDTLWASAVGALVVVFIVFFYSFTGKKTPLKNRIAIIFSYCVIGIFLFVPLTAPVFLVPSDRRAMMDRPVGLVLTKIGPAEDANIQWALNIGGYATSPPQPTPAPSVQTQTTVKSPSAGATPTAQPSASPTSGTVPPAEAASPSPVPTPTRTPQTSASPAVGARTPTPSPSPQVVASNDEDLVVDIKTGSGLVIPLYIIILSVIGGAINMTRKVPQLQEEGERSEIVVPGIRVRGIGSRIKSGWNSMVHRSTETNPPPPSTEPPSSEQTSEPGKTGAPATAPASPPPSQPKPSASAPAADETVAAQIDAKVGELLDLYGKSDLEAQDAKNTIRDLVTQMKELFDKRTDKKRILDYDSFDDWLKSRPAIKDLFRTHWRVELLSQYMYLVSAPFLAIVAYYMLELAGLTKQPILVLISFSVGLVSERILSWLLGIASGYLRESPSQPASR